MNRSISAPAIQEELTQLKAGDIVNLTGTILTGRDAAHKRMMEYLDKSLPLPFDIKNQVIYYVGPCPAGPGKIIGSCGPTTSSRMDSYTPRLLGLGLKMMIGKGQRSPEVIDAIVRNQAVYLAAVGGAAALIAQCVKKAQVIAFDDLGPEAVYRLEVESFPLIVAIDAKGNNLYEIGPGQYKSNNLTDRETSRSFP
jgi:fumarate hydratase subunit beta